ncbi:hypothetical protein KI387_007224, partial [Taxus chinensis]
SGKEITTVIFRETEGKNYSVLLPIAFFPSPSHKSCENAPVCCGLLCGFLFLETQSRIVGNVGNEGKREENFADIHCSTSSIAVQAPKNLQIRAWVASGKLCQQWDAHNKPVSCLAFSDDSSLLISGADDGIIHVWPLIGILDTEDDSQGDTSSICLHSWVEHRSSITDLAVSCGGSSSVVISCSLDCTCKIHGRFPWAKHSQILDPRELESLRIRRALGDAKRIHHRNLFYKNKEGLGIPTGLLVPHKMRSLYEALAPKLQPNRGLKACAS